MTAIIGFTKGNTTYIAGERGNSDSSLITPSLSPKVLNIGPYAIGYAGLTGIGQSILYTLDFPIPPHNIDIYRYLVSSFIPLLRNHLSIHNLSTDREDDATDLLLGYKGRLFEISTYDFQCVEYEYSCIGSGREFSLGAYSILQNISEDPIYIAKTCIETANKFSTTCCGKVDIVYS